jgi:hypothetical protein
MFAVFHAMKYESRNYFHHEELIIMEHFQLKKILNIFYHNNMTLIKFKLHSIGW